MASWHADARATPRERPVALLQFANPVQQGLRHQLCTKPIRRRWFAIFPVEDGDEFPPEGPNDEPFRIADSWPVMSAGEARFVRHRRTGENVGRSGCVHARSSMPGSLLYALGNRTVWLGAWIR
jgi:hypothetical protein